MQSFLYVFVLTQAAILLIMASAVLLIRIGRRFRESTEQLEIAHLRTLVFESLMQSNADLQDKWRTADPARAIEAISGVAQTAGPGERDRMKDMIRSGPLREKVEIQLRSPVWWKRHAAARLLQFLPMDDFLPALRELRQDAEPMVRLEAIRALAGYGALERARSFGGWREMGWLLDHLPIDTLHEQYAGLSILELEDLISQEDDPAALIRLIRLSRRLGASTRFLMDMARHSNRQVRLAAIDELAQAPTDDTHQMLKECLEESDWEIRARSATSLVAQRRAGSVHAIATLLVDDDRRVRLLAAVALKRFGSAGHDALRFMAQTTTDPVRRRLFEQVMELPER